MLFFLDVPSFPETLVLSFLKFPNRKHFVSSGAMRPTWKPFASKTLAEQQLHFSLRLMTGGDASNIGADVLQHWNFDLIQAVLANFPSYRVLIAATQGAVQALLRLFKMRNSNLMVVVVVSVHGDEL